jgi:hypothetical protein
MGAPAIQQPFNDIQLHLLRMFSYNRSEQSLLELQEVLFDYYRKKAKKQTDEFWKANNLNADKMEEIMYGHNRVSVK